LSCKLSPVSAVSTKRQDASCHPIHPIPRANNPALSQTTFKIMLPRFSSKKIELNKKTGSILSLFFQKSNNFF